MRNNIKILVFFKQMSKLKISLVVGVSCATPQAWNASKDCFLMCSPE